MGKRKRLGLLFNYNENWIGGIYYIVNLIHALNTLPENIKPYISIISYKKKSFTYLQDETKYPYLVFVNDKSGKPIWEKIVNAFSLRSFKRKLIQPKLDNRYDLIFPNPLGDYYSLIDDARKVFWIPDFQDVHLPHFYNVDELIVVKQRQIAQAYKAQKMVLSSIDAQQDFLKLFPDSKATIFVIPFSVSHPNFQSVDVASLLNKWGVNRAYHFVTNQFWKHKNHLVVIQAVKLLVSRGMDVLILFSGKESDYRNPHHVTNLKKTVGEAGLDDNIKFLGFLDRKEQLAVMQNSISVIQPSLFEGWSTVIEDAKALNKKIIVSDLGVHREQLAQGDSYLFFNPHSEEELAEAIIRIEEIPDKSFSDYTRNRQEHARKFYALFDE